MLAAILRHSFPVKSSEPEVDQREIEILDLASFSFLLNCYVMHTTAVQCLVRCETVNEIETLYLLN